MQHVFFIGAPGNGSEVREKSLMIRQGMLRITKPATL